MGIASVTYGSMNNSERAVFRTAALSNDEWVNAEGAGSSRPNRYGRNTNLLAVARPYSCVQFSFDSPGSGARTRFEVCAGSSPGERERVPLVAGRAARALVGLWRALARVELRVVGPRALRVVSTSRSRSGSTNAAHAWLDVGTVPGVCGRARRCEDPVMMADHGPSAATSAAKYDGSAPYGFEPSRSVT
jgi:hypothetical protein